MTVIEEPLFDRPVFIVSTPRSGSTLLFETLSRAPDVYTIGGESHRLIESIPQLDIRARDHASNRLLAQDAVPEVVDPLRQRFHASMRDRDGAALASGHGRFRMLEKTPKNSLRIPFLLKAFPEAHFAFLYRDPRQVLASMMEAWMSGRFKTCAGLPGWPLPYWSLLLTQGGRHWRESRWPRSSPASGRRRPRCCWTTWRNCRRDAASRSAMRISWLTLRPGSSTCARASAWRGIVRWTGRCRWPGIR